MECVDLREVDRGGVCAARIGCMRFIQVDVFAEGPYQGNPLAVFPDSGELTPAQMQAIAREMNLSETTFVTGADAGGYDVRIFTPNSELPFAGHPTLGTTWVLRHLSRISGEVVQQRSAAGSTTVELRDGLLWLEREATVVEEAYEVDPALIGLTSKDIGCEINGTRVEPALSSAGFPQLMVPVVDTAALDRAHPGWDVPYGVYCFTVAPGGRISARGFFPTFGVPEDPATGSAAAALGLYLGARVGAGNAVIDQGAACGRPSVLHMDWEPAVVRVGGRCQLVAVGELVSLP